MSTWPETRSLGGVALAHLPPGWRSALLDRVVVIGPHSRAEIEAAVGNWLRRGASAGIAGALASAGLPMAFGQPPRWSAVLASAALGPLLVWISLNHNAERARRRIRTRLPLLLDLLVLALNAGAGLLPALQSAASRLDGPLRAHLDGAAAAVYAGVPLAVALRETAAAIGLREFDALVTSVVVAELLGSPLGDVCRSQARAIRRHARRRLEEGLGVLPLQLTAVTIVFFFPVLFVLTVLPNIVQFNAW